MSDEPLDTDAPQPATALDDTDSAADPEQHQRKRVRKKTAEQEASEFWAQVMASAVGRREVWKLLQDAGTFAVTFACGPTGAPQPEATWYHNGQRDYGLGLHKMLLRRDPQSLALMHQEHDPDFQEAQKQKRVTHG